EQVPPLDAVKLVRAQGDRLHAISQVLALRAPLGALDHPRRPVRGRNAMPPVSHANGVQTCAAPQVDQAGAWSKRGVQPAPHLGAHVLDQAIVAAWPVIVRGDTVEGLLRGA